MNAGVLAYATTGPHRARAQSALADGARARNRTFSVHGSTRLLLRLTNRRSLTRGSCSLSPFAYPLPNS